MRVILADPSRTVQMAVAGILRSRGHVVLTFSNGCEALAHLRADDTIDALITSTEPMGISGFELCWEARLIATARRPIYIIMMSASRDQTIICEALDSGADDFISKPPLAEELYARMRAAERLMRLECDLIRLASTDPLTGALNRRAFFELAQDAAGHARRGAALAAVMLDIDYFKRINDVYGHDRGDQALCDVARAAQAEGAVLGRLGGEEFAILLPGARMTEAAALAERVRQRIVAIAIATEKGIMKLTCSFGVSEWEEGDSVDHMLKRADTALYQAKSGGRNRVVAAVDVAAGTAQSSDLGSVARATERSDWQIGHVVEEMRRGSPR